jgi:Glycosyl transferase family 2
MSEETTKNAASEKSSSSEQQKPFLNPYDYERSCKQVIRLLRCAEGRQAIKEGLVKTLEGQEIIRSEFNVAIYDPTSKERKPIVAVLIPGNKNPESRTVQTLEQMIQATRDVAHVIVRPSVETSVVHWVRNYMLAQLYESGTPFDYVLFMDDDMAPPSDALKVLLSRNVDVIGAVCTVRQDPPLPNARYYDAAGMFYQTADIDRPGVWKVGAIGSGFLLLSKKALEAVGEYTLTQAFAKKYLGMSEEVAKVREAREKSRAAKDRNQYWFEFLKHPKGEGEWGEDVAFCFKAMECGFDVYADSTVIVGHVGKYAFSLHDYLDYRSEALRSGLVVRLGQGETPEGSEPSHEKISIVVPTRGRPENVRRLVESINSTAEEVPEVVLYIDDDDKASADCAQSLGVKHVVGPRCTLSDCWNRAAQHATGDILMVGGDDLVFKTKHWDRMVKQGFASCEDRILLVHGEDGHWGNRFASHPFLHRKWIDTVGYFTPPHFSSDFTDTWLNDVANALGRRMYLSFEHEHLHPLFGKADWDKTHKERLERAKADGVEALYQEKAPERKKDVEKLRAVIREAKDAAPKQEVVSVG